MYDETATIILCTATGPLCHRRRRLLCDAHINAATGARGLAIIVAAAAADVSDGHAASVHRMLNECVVLAAAVPRKSMCTRN